MQPTNKVRWQVRKRMTFNDVGEPRGYEDVTVLQQWWEITEHGDDGLLYDGCWRDVPTEVESE